MIFMAVCDDDASYLVAVVKKISEVGNYEIYPKHVFLGEHEPAVNHYNILVVLQDGHVEANLLNTTEGDYRECIFH